MHCFETPRFVSFEYFVVPTKPRFSVLASGSWDTHLRIWALRESNIEPNPGLCRRGCLLAHCSAVGQLEFDDELRCVAIDQTGVWKNVVVVLVDSSTQDFAWLLEPAMVV